MPQAWLHVRKKLFQRLQAPGGGANADDWGEPAWQVGWQSFFSALGRFGLPPEGRADFFMVQFVRNCG
jgi:hypothetical protein